MEDKNPTVHIEDPFSYNYIALKKTQVDEKQLPGVNDVIVDPLSNAIGHELGIDNPHKWNKLYQKVFVITEWAKERSGLTDPGEIIKWINEKSQGMATLGAKKINSLYANIMLGIRRGKNES